MEEELGEEQFGCRKRRTRGSVGIDKDKETNFFFVLCISTHSSMFKKLKRQMYKIKKE